MTTIFPGADYRTLSGALANTNQTEIFSVDGRNGDGALLVFLRVVDSTGSVGTPVQAYCQLSSSDTERTFHFSSVAANVLTYDGPPIRLGFGGTIDIKGASGHHWWLTYLPLVSGQQAIAGG